MSAKSVVAALVGFLAHHVGDLNVLSSALTEIVNVVPIDSQDKARIADAINTVQQSADNINNFLQNNTVTGGEVVVKESDLVAAIAAYFSSDAGKATLANVGKSNG